MENFIKKMMEIGASIELSCSKNEEEIFMSEAKKEYQKHFKLLIQQNNLNTGLRLIPNDEEILVLDIESNTINELVSIDVGESRVVMHAEEAGFTSNLISKVELYIEPKS